MSTTEKIAVITDSCADVKLSFFCFRKIRQQDGDKPFLRLKPVSDGCVGGRTELQMDGSAVAALIKRREESPLLQRLDGFGYMGFGQISVLYNIGRRVKSGIVVQKKENIHLCLEQAMHCACFIDTLFVDDIPKNLIVNKL